MKKLFLLIGFLLSACGGYSPIHYQPVPMPRTQNIVESKNFEAVQTQSFSEAVMLYPTRLGNTYHTIPVGDYLIGRIVTALPGDSEISEIRLDAYDSKCGMTGFFIAHALCRTRASFSVKADGIVHLLDVFDEADVGPMFIPGDIAPPLTMGDKMEGMMQLQAMTSVKHLVPKIAAAFQRALRTVPAR